MPTAFTWPRKSASHKFEMNDSALWEVARAIYAVGLLTLGVVLVGLALVFLRVLPGALRVGRQLAKAITRHAKVLERDADAADAVRRVEEKLTEVGDDVKTIKGRLDDDVGESGPKRG